MQAARIAEFIKAEQFRNIATRLRKDSTRIKKIEREGEKKNSISLK